MGLAIQAEQLPKLRDKLLAIVGEINLVLNDGKTRGRNGPRKAKASPDLTTRGTPRIRKAPTLKKARRSFKQPDPILLDELPDDAVRIPTIAAGFRWSPSRGMVSLLGKQPRLLRLPSSTKCYGLKGRNGERVFLSQGKLKELLAKVGVAV